MSSLVTHDVINVLGESGEDAGGVLFELWHANHQLQGEGDVVEIPASAS